MYLLLISRERENFKPLTPRAIKKSLGLDTPIEGLQGSKES